MSYTYSPAKVNLSYLRDIHSKEIDVIIEENNMIHALEIKKSANPVKRDQEVFNIR